MGKILCGAATPTPVSIERRRHENRLSSSALPENSTLPKTTTAAAPLNRFMSNWLCAQL